MEPDVDEGAAALREDRAYADLSDWRTILARGSDSRNWLNDLLTADIGALPTGSSRPALLLSPTGRIRATVTVASIAEGLLLIQDPAQPLSIDTLLAPYILSSEVELEDVSRSVALFAFPGGEPPHAPGAEVIRPSTLGSGADLIVPRKVEQTLRLAVPGLTRVGLGALEAWRIHRGVPRFPVDLTPESLPHEADLDAAIDYGKGCYLGQEAVAKVRNLGHPTWVVLSMRAEGTVAPNDPVMREGEEVGKVTSAASVDGLTVLIARVRWAARDVALATVSGTPLQTSGVASAAA
jgi:tRNA-modifying protein YgfZ